MSGSRVRIVAAHARPAGHGHGYGHGNGLQFELRSCGAIDTRLGEPLCGTPQRSTVRHIIRPSLPVQTQKYNLMLLATVLSEGQYIHLTLPPWVRLPKRASDSAHTTWPQDIIIGGFSSVACSLETGQVKVEWKRRWEGRGISICG